MARNCPACNENLEAKEVTPITINNSQSQYFTRGEKGICELDVVFTVNFPGNDGVTTVDICNECYSNRNHLSEEYLNEYM